ncbi:hypothetical protein HYDPIDRAFT_25100 [Hydnomerulius pinastri MD-312]|nr:hypothetical protein HYDPIDRAFT_25100 [Hydnomerulius pinastri MD-312]
MEETSQINHHDDALNSPAGFSEADVLDKPCPSISSPINLSIKMEDVEESQALGGSQKRKGAPSPEQSEPDDATPDHSRKRLRTGDFTSREQPRMKKHANFWYSDADTIIVVEDVLYKLSSSRLKDQSELFQDLLSGQPNNHTLEEIEVSHQPEETWYIIRHLTAKDFDVLLNMDRRPTDFCLTMPSFQDVAAILRSATLLKMDGYRAFAIHYLRSWWPSDLCCVTQNRRPYAVETFLLCRQCNVPQVLKPVFYELIRDPRGRFKVPGANASHKQGNTGCSASSQAEHLEERALDALSRDDETLVLRAREIFLIAWFDTTIRNPSRSCALRGSDNKVKQCPSSSKKNSTWEALVHTSGLFQKFMYDPIGGFEALAAVAWKSEAEKWCSQCVERMGEKWTKRAQELWDQLDEILELGEREVAT